MDRKYCYLVTLTHPDGVDEQYVIFNIDDLSLCIKDYASDYSVSFFEPFEVLIKKVYLEGGDADGKRLQSGKEK